MRSLGTSLLLFMLLLSHSGWAQEQCGVPLAEFRGVTAYSNGTAEQRRSAASCGGRGAYGLQYQCVEYVRRFYAEASGSNVDLSGLNAVDFFEMASSRGLNAYASGDTTVRPEADDILVLTGPPASGLGHFGHVAIVTEVTTDKVNVIEQNWSASGVAELTLEQDPAGSYTIDNRQGYTVLGWLRLPSSEIILQPGPEGVDVWISSFYSWGDNYGVDDYRLRPGGWGDQYYGLIQFDISSLPGYAAKAEIQLYPFSSASGTSVSLYLDQVLGPWDESLGWFSADRPATVKIGDLPAPTLYQWYTIDITDLYNDWKSGNADNYGIQLRPTATNNRFDEFYSSDYTGDPSLRPKLVVTP